MLASFEQALMFVPGTPLVTNHSIILTQRLLLRHAHSTYLAQTKYNSELLPYRSKIY